MSMPNFGEAIMARVIASSDPSVKMQQQAIQGFVQQQQNEATAQQAEYVELIASKLMACGAGTPDVVLTAYADLLRKLSR